MLSYSDIKAGLRCEGLVAALLSEFWSPLFLFFDLIHVFVYEESCIV